MHRTDKYCQRISIIWPVRLNGWLFVYKLSSCRFESRCRYEILIPLDDMIANMSSNRKLEPVITQ